MLLRLDGCDLSFRGGRISQQASYPSDFYDASILSSTMFLKPLLSTFTGLCALVNVQAIFFILDCYLELFSMVFMLTSLKDNVVKYVFLIVAQNFKNQETISLS